MNSRKAQITTFMIIGIILLFSSALFFYTKNTLVAYKPIERPLIEVAPLEAQPIQKYVTECVQKVAIDAVERLGLNGGYINPPGGEITQYLDPTKADALIYPPSRIPYWYYLDDSQRMLSSKRPALFKTGGDLNSMEAQLDSYVKDKLKPCLNEFKIFSNQFSIIGSEINVDTRINEETVTVRVDYPLTIMSKATNQETKISKFYTSLPVRLKQIYDLATAIISKEQEDHRIANNIIKKLASESGLEKKIPPMFDSTLFTSEKKFWTQQEIKQEVQSKVLPYVNNVQVANTAYFSPIIVDPNDPQYMFKQGYYTTSIIDATDRLYKEIGVKMSYPGSEFYFRIENQKELVKPNSITPDTKDILAMIGRLFFNDYSNFFTIAFPVLVKFTDVSAFNGKGYEFYVAIEINIKNNLPAMGNITLREAPAYAEPYVDLNDPEVVVKKDIIVRTYNATNLALLEGVDVYYACGRQFSIGQTKKVGTAAELRARFPYCAMGGRIIVKKDGYLGYSRRFDNNDEKNLNSIELQPFYMWPVVKKKIVACKRSAINLEILRNNNAQPDNPFYRVECINVNENDRDDLLLLTVERVTGSDPYEDIIPLIPFAKMGNLGSSSGGSGVANMNYDSTKNSIQKAYDEGGITAAQKDELLSYVQEAEKNVNEFRNSQQYRTFRSSVKSSNEIDLVPGIYRLEGNMIKSGNPAVHIPKKTMHVCPGVELGGLCIGKEPEDIELPEQNFPVWPYGGISDFRFEIKPEDLYGSSQNLTVYVLSFPLPSSWSDIQDSGGMPDLAVETVKNENFLKPVWG